MILYHGSNVKVSVPDLSRSKPFKDFGQGFYLSAEEQQAKDQALSLVRNELSKHSKPYEKIERTADTDDEGRADG